MPPKRKHRRRRQKGGSVKDLARAALSQAKQVAKAAYEQARENQVLSNALKLTGFERLGTAAEAFGYGARRHRRQKGHGVGDFLKSIVTAPLAAGAALTSGLYRGVDGLGRRRQRGGKRWGFTLPLDAPMTSQQNAILPAPMYAMGGAGLYHGSQAVINTPAVVLK